MLGSTMVCGKEITGMREEQQPVAARNGLDRGGGITHDWVVNCLRGRYGSGKA